MKHLLIFLLLTTSAQAASYRVPDGSILVLPSGARWAVPAGSVLVTPDVAPVPEPVPEPNPRPQPPRPQPPRPQPPRPQPPRPQPPRPSRPGPSRPPQPPQPPRPRQPIRRHSTSLWIAYRPIREVSGYPPILTDVESHLPAGHPYDDPDRITTVHECTHGINSLLRAQYGCRAFYVLKDRAVLLDEPATTLAAVAAQVPPSLRGEVYELYLVRRNPIGMTIRATSLTSGSPTPTGPMPADNSVFPIGKRRCATLWNSASTQPACHKRPNPTPADNSVFPIGKRRCATQPACHRRPSPSNKDR